MNIIISNSLFIKRGLRIILLLLFNLLITQNSFSIKHWGRDDVYIVYNKKFRTIRIDWLFIDYVSGQWFEHGFLEWLDLEFTVDGEHFEKLMSCQVKNQPLTSMSVVSVSNKLLGARLNFVGSLVPLAGALWRGENLDAQFPNNNQGNSHITMRWYVPSNIVVKQLLFKGVWRVSGLNCSETIAGTIFDIPPMVSLESKIETDPKQKYVLDQAENIELKLYKEGDAVVVKGAGLGENIRVYTTTGALVKSMVADRDVLQISLPANQMYLVHVGQARYKVAL